MNSNPSYGEKFEEWILANDNTFKGISRVLLFFLLLFISLVLVFNLFVFIAAFSKLVLSAMIFMIVFSWVRWTLKG